MIEVVQTVWSFVVEHFWTMVALLGILVYGKTIHDKYVFTPLAGGNGKIQMDELAKGIIMAILIWAVQRDGYRGHEWAYFSDVFYATLLAGIFAIAAIKPVTSVLNTRYNGKSKQPVQGSNNSDSSIPVGDSGNEVGNEGNSSTKRNREGEES